jgi:hypothetical protein
VLPGICALPIPHWRTPAKMMGDLHTPGDAPSSALRCGATRVPEHAAARRACTRGR